MPRYNKLCPMHPATWDEQKYMREDDVVCRDCYFRLPPDLKPLVWDEDPSTQQGNWSIVTDWLEENPAP